MSESFGRGLEGRGLVRSVMAVEVRKCDARYGLLWNGGQGRVSSGWAMRGAAGRETAVKVSRGKVRLVEAV